MAKLKALIFSQTIKDTLISFTGLGFAAVVGFAYTVILARTLGPEKFGIFSVIIAIVSIIYSLGDLGISAALVNFIPKQKESNQSYINTAFWVEGLVSIAILFTFGALIVFREQAIPGSQSSQLLIGAVLAINYLFIGFAQGLFTAERRFINYSLSQIIDSGIKILIVYSLLTLNNLSIQSALLANVVSTFIALAITFSKEALRIKPLFDKVIFFQLYTFAKWIAVSRFFSVLVSRIDIILLNLLAGSFQAGIYSAANRVTFLFILIVSSLGSVINPRFSSFETREKVITYTKKLLGLITLISVVMLAAAIFANPIIHLIFGEKFLLSTPVFQALTIAMIPFIFSLVTIPALLYSFDQPRFVAVVTWIQVMSLIVIEIIFIPQIGPYAPPLALGITNLFVLLVTGIKLHSLLHKNER